MRGRKSFVKRPLQNEEMSLQITSMADIFTIILIFLLKSYATGAVELIPSAGLQLPQANGNMSPVQALKVELSENAVLIEGKPVAMMRNFEFASSDLDSQGVSRSLQGALARERNLESGQESGKAPDPRIVVIADQRAPYSSIKTVLASAAVQGYTDFKLAVNHGE